MQILFFAVIASLIGGASVSMQSALASLIGQRLGSMESIFIVHLGGALAIGLPLILMGGRNLGEWRSVPWYALLAGALGIVVVGGANFAIPRLGVTTTITIFVTGQLCVSLLLDQFGLLGIEPHPITWTRLLGVGILALGARLVMG
jgi:bacterial/archaeal transporter family-2 protein